ncbi:DM13 domain-containing protein [Micromonospora sp. WMMD987]|uniref:DM13 domain-containing protein n=1 Tax=Micromonospora sp. WMMD987 TaxID=3016089 RepID=UPI00249BEA1C|nr:DM13 domain-containing protein [Micromonospora sp. WMMD987]WFE94705.1 DM13 domain-containing protein [Micromonospora sp. WMMD987]
MSRRLLRAPLTWVAVAVLGVGVAFGLYWFQPWKVVTDNRVDEQLSEVDAAPTGSAPTGATPTGTTSTDATPTGATPTGATPTGTTSTGATPTGATPTAPAGQPPAGSPTGTRPVVVSRGAFVSHEHDTSGDARIVRTTDGRHRLELVGLDTSNGPDLKVWLTDQPVRTGRAGWGVFDDGRRVELGRLKGNRGDQAYAIPAGTDLTGLTSVTIWCQRFAVSFGAAPLVAGG